MISRQKRILELIAIFIFVVVVFSSLKEANQAYPYYLSWDMDLITSIDLLMIQSQKLHVHFAHPGTGLYLILKPIHYVANQLGLVNTLNLSDLSAAHNPSLAMAQVTAFARVVSPFIVTFICIFLSFTVFLTGQSSIFFRFLVLALIFSGYWVIQQATFIRTETFAWLHLSLAILFAMLAAKSRSPNKKNIFLGLVGIFFGLTYYTKIQSLPTLALPLIVFVIYNNIPLSIEGSYNKKLSLITLTTFLILILASLFYGFAPNSYIEPFREGVAFTAHGLLLLVSLSLLCYFSFKPTSWANWFNFCIPISSGFVFSFFIPLFQYANFSRGFELTLFNFQSVVMTKIYTGLSSQVEFTLGRGFNVFSQALPIFLPLVLIYGLVLLSQKKDLFRTRLKWGLGAIVGLVVFNLFFVVRNAARQDIVWYEPAAYLAIVLAVSALWNDSAKLKWSGIIIVVSMISINCVNTQLAYNNTQFSYGAERPFLRHVYSGQSEYASVYYKYVEGLPEERGWQLTSQLLRQAREHKSIDFFLRFHFINLKPDIRWVSSAQKGFKISEDNWRIADVSEGLRGQNILDLNQAVSHTPRRGWFNEFISRLLIEPEFTKKWSDPRKIVLTRMQPDISSVVLLNRNQNKNINCQELTKDLWLNIEKVGQEPVHLGGYYCKDGIPYESLQGLVLVAMLFNNP